MSSLLASAGGAVVGSLFTAGATLWNLKKARSLSRAKFLYDLHKDFFVDETYRSALNHLDDSDNTIKGLVQKEDAKLLQLLNAFELVAYFVKTRELEEKDAEALLGYYLDCFQKHPSLSDYINDKSKSFETLRTFVSRRKNPHGA
ncbi:hypothetical protein [Edaphobacter sp.]|uniref:hypothetical protein n=1 Tax=Edaphobacter sp. TaxID=1934404 RepID=UPI002DC0549E|nr:hypothetical protein [Edaphobacter sp.]HEU5341731.1 hypothetical protein [Edaphobacter sp.]